MRKSQKSEKAHSGSVPRRGKTIDQAYQEIKEMLQKNYGLGADTVSRILADTPPGPMQQTQAEDLDQIEDIEKLAEDLGIAAYFLVRRPTGIEETVTPQFNRLSAT